MAKENKPKRGPNRELIYLWLEDVLRECRMKMMGEYILIWQQTIALYVATRPILNECRQGEWKRGDIPHHWWWEQPMGFRRP
jgi:hypothetical protein